MITTDEINKIKDLLNDEFDKWRLDVGDWIGYVEWLIDEVNRLQGELDWVNSWLRDTTIDKY